MKHFKPSAFLMSGVLASTLAFSQAPSPVAPDNSKSNKTDQNNAISTADAQSNKSNDVQTTRRIRQAVMADKSLSTYAHNVKIVTTHGAVTLNGVVRSEAEKQSLEMKAASIAGKDNVMSDIKVTPAT